MWASSRRHQRRDRGPLSAIVAAGGCRRGATLVGRLARLRISSIRRRARTSGVAGRKSSRSLGQIRPDVAAARHGAGGVLASRAAAREAPPHSGIAETIDAASPASSALERA